VSALRGVESRGGLAMGVAHGNPNVLNE